MNFLRFARSQASFGSWTLFVLVAALAGCGRNDVQVYRVAKEQPASGPQAQAPSSGMPAGHPDVAGGPPTLKWILPTGWQEVAPGEMRLGSFRVPGQGGKSADVSIVPLPGMAGSDLDNVNRWRGQVGLGPVSEQELAKLAQPLTIGGQPASLYDQAGKNPGSGDRTRILAALMRRDGIAWFFKMTGDAALVDEQKPVFIGFLKTLSFPAASAQAAQSELPPSHPPIGGADMMAPSPAPVASSSNEGKPSWQVPPGWRETAAGQFLIAKFLLSGDDNSQAAVNVSMSAGDGGGLLANVNRWRGQLGLPPADEASLSQQAQSLEISGAQAKLVDLTGTDARTGQKARMVGAIVPQGGQTWFYKLMGSEPLVGQQKDAFTKFVQTVKY